MQFRSDFLIRVLIEFEFSIPAMTPCSEGFPLTRYPPMNGTPQFPIYVQPPPPPPPPPPLHESYAYNRTYPPQGLPTFHRPDIAQLRSYVDRLFLSQKHEIEAFGQRIARLENENSQLKVQVKRILGEEESSPSENTTTESSSAPINSTERSNAAINLTVESRAPINSTTERSHVPVNSTRESSVPVISSTERPSVPVNSTRGSSILVNSAERSSVPVDPIVESSAPMSHIIEELNPTGFDPLNDETLTQPSGGVHESPVAESTEDSEADSLCTRPQIYEEVPIVPLPLDPIKPPKGQLYLMGGLDRNGRMNRTVRSVKRVRFV